MKNKLAKLELISASLIFGSIGVCRKALPLNSGMLSMLRGFIGVAVLLIILFISRQKIDFKAIRSNLKLLVISGIAIGINWILLFEAYKYTSVSVAVLCYYMAPIFMVVASPFVLKERINKTGIICIIISLIGMFFVSEVWKEKSNPAQYIGIMFSLGAAVLYATDVLCNKKMSSIGALDRTIIQLFLAAVVTIPYILFVEEPVHYELTAKIVLLVAFMGIAHTGIGFALSFDGMSKLSTQTVAFFTYLDPVTSVILSVIFLNEKLSFSIIIGAVCIIGSALYNELKTN